MNDYIKLEIFIPESHFPQLQKAQFRFSKENQQQERLLKVCHLQAFLQSQKKYRHKILLTHPLRLSHQLTARLILTLQLPMTLHFTPSGKTPSLPTVSSSGTRALMTTRTPRRRPTSSSLRIFAKKLPLRRSAQPLRTEPRLSASFTMRRRAILPLL